MTDQSIYLVRHGETAFNADGRLRGLADPDLNAAGLGQATRLAESIYSNCAQVTFFTDRLVTRALPGLLDEATADPALMEQVFDEFLAPRRQSTARALQRAVERGETRPGVDTDWICDLLTGPLLMRALLPTGPIDANLARLTVETALEASTV